MITIREVAQRAGVSIATVSYVINNGPRPVRPATRQKVLQAMAELDYRPDDSARRLARGRTNCLGLALHGLSNANFATYFFLEYIRGVAAAAEAHQQNLMLFTGANTTSEADYYLEVVGVRAVDGLILLGSGISDEVIQLVANSGFPCVLLARRIAGLKLPCVLQDYRQGAYLATRHLLEQKHRRIGFLGQVLQFSYVQERLEGYQQALAEAALPFDPALISIPDQVRDDPTLDEVTRLLDAGATALLTDREVVVLNLLKSLGCRVPDEIALMGLEASTAGPLADPPLSTLQAPKFELLVRDWSIWPSLSSH